MPTTKEQLIVGALCGLISIAGLYALYQNWPRIIEGLPSIDSMREDRDMRVKWCNDRGGTAQLGPALLFEGCTLPPKDHRKDM